MSFNVRYTITICMPMGEKTLNYNAISNLIELHVIGG